MQNVLHCNSEQRSSVSNHEQCSLSEYSHVRCEVPCYEDTAELNIRYSGFGLVLRHMNCSFFYLIENILKVAYLSSVSLTASPEISGNFERHVDLKLLFWSA